MSSVRRFQDLDVWKDARLLVQMIHELTSQTHIRSDRPWVWQIERAALSCMSNIAEGFGRRTPRDFARFLQITIGSACEVLSLIYVGVDRGYIDDHTFNDARAIIQRITGRSRALRRYLIHICHTTLS